jgi:hypothetical protein
MLPGFRHLAIIVAFAASVLIFGLGAVALLRTTHQEFAAIPLRNLQTPSPGFVAETPTLAVLQVEPVVEEQVQPAPVPVPAPAPTPLAEVETAPPEDDVTVPRIVIPNPPPIPLTDATVTASVETPPQPAVKPAAAPAAAIKARPVARKHVRAKTRARHRAHHHRRRIVRPAPPPVEQGFFPLFDPMPAAPAPTVASTNPPRR